MTSSNIFKDKNYEDIKMDDITMLTSTSPIVCLAVMGRVRFERSDGADAEQEQHQNGSHVGGCVTMDSKVLIRCKLYRSHSLYRIIISRRNV